ncbi:MAG: DNA-formamidopyrimidine glycosylase family protein [Bacteroidota bacterium]
MQFYAYYRALSIRGYGSDKQVKKNDMPEGPSIVLLKEAVSQFTGKKIISVEGNTKTIDKIRLQNQKVIAFKSWGKHFLICFKDFSVRVHFLLFGSYLINEKKATSVRLSLTFGNGQLNLYACSLKIIEGDIENHYDWHADVMNDLWDARQAELKLKKIPSELICDALLEQHIFAGVGNIIKNEILYRVRVHPESIVSKISTVKIRKLIKEARDYSFEFLEWKRNFVLRIHWLVHTKTICIRCKGPIIKKYTGTKNRRSFFCNKCQHLYK